jgi:hypothetical protein
LKTIKEEVIEGNKRLKETLKIWKEYYNSLKCSPYLKT